MSDISLVEWFCIFDDFCKYFTFNFEKYMLQVFSKLHRNYACCMLDSEIITILVQFHSHRFRNLKFFYLSI